MTAVVRLEDLKLEDEGAQLFKAALSTTQLDGKVVEYSATTEQTTIHQTCQAPRIELKV
jgi:hypothetical protein